MHDGYSSADQQSSSTSSQNMVWVSDEQAVAESPKLEGVIAATKSVRAFRGRESA